MDWCEWFGFEYDPFFDKPLATDNEMHDLLIVEKRMEEQIYPLLRQMAKVPFLCIVSGQRGVGKSTFIYYSINLCEKSGYLAVYVGLDHFNLENSNRPVYDIERSLMYELAAKILDEVANSKKSFFSDNKNILMTLARYLGLGYNEAEGFMPTGDQFRPDYFELKRYLLAILNRSSSLLLYFKINRLLCNSRALSCTW
jgi:hypothetical protein